MPCLLPEARQPSLVRSSQDGVAEETSILCDDGAQRKPILLPKTRLFLLFSARLAEPIVSHSTIAYISELVNDLSVVGGDKRKRLLVEISYISLLYAAEDVAVLQWSRSSDHVGRKPILSHWVSVSSVVSMILFELPRSFWALVLRVVGPFIGGVLSRPQDHWPDRFSHPFWAGYRYFLTCFAAAPYALISSFVTAIDLEEKESASQAPKKDPEAPLLLRALLTSPVLVSVSRLRDARTALHGRHGAHPACLGDARLLRRAQPQPGLHRPVDV
ncbi:hypothetical protein H4582DRAFT_2095249 [Lactarius indigo]|nr:hypothetical protein H4582DRAFT_2095249 [Lactarius indigo]